MFDSIGMEGIVIESMFLLYCAFINLYLNIISNQFRWDTSAANTITRDSRQMDPFNVIDRLSPLRELALSIFHGTMIVP